MSKNLNDFEKDLADARLVNYKFRTETKEFYEFAEKLVKALEIFRRNCLLSQYPDGTYELAFPNKIQPSDEDAELLKEILK